MGKLKEKIIEKGSGLIVKSKTKNKLQKFLPKPIAKQISKKVGKATEQLTSKAIDLWNKIKIIFIDMFVYTFENIGNIKNLKHSDSIKPKHRERWKGLRKVCLILIILNLKIKPPKMNHYKHIMNSNHYKILRYSVRKR